MGLTPAEYKETRKRLGTQAEVANMLGVSRPLISMRESNKAEISKEAELAILSLLEKKDEKELASFQD